MFLIIPQKYLKAIKFSKKLVSIKVSDMWSVPLTDNINSFH